MPESSIEIPEGAWPFIDGVILVLVVSTAIWLCFSIFIFWRRRATNLTPVHAARKNKKADPDFLNDDRRGRAAAIKRGEAYEKELAQQEAEEARLRKRKAFQQLTVMQRASRLITLAVSFFTLATIVAGTVFQLSYMGRLLSEYSAIDRLVAVVTNHPIGSSIATIVIVYHIVRFFMEGRWRLDNADA